MKELKTGIIVTSTRINGVEVIKAYTPSEWEYYQLAWWNKAKQTIKLLTNRNLFLTLAVLFTINTFAQQVVVRRTAVEDNGRAFIDTDLQYRFTVDFENNTVTRDKGAKHKPIYKYNLGEVYTEGDIKYKWTAYEGSYISQLGIRVNCMIIEYRQKDEFTGDALIKKFYGRIKTNN